MKSQGLHWAWGGNWGTGLKERNQKEAGDTCSQVVKTSFLPSVWTRIIFKHYPGGGPLRSKWPQPCLWDSLNGERCVKICRRFWGTPTGLFSPYLNLLLVWVRDLQTVKERVKMLMHGNIMEREKRQDLSRRTNLNAHLLWMHCCSVEAVYICLFKMTADAERRHAIILMYKTLYALKCYNF